MKRSSGSLEGFGEVSLKNLNCGKWNSTGDSGGGLEDQNIDRNVDNKGCVEASDGN
jgi:hypothetical protein